MHEAPQRSVGWLAVLMPLMLATMLSLAVLAGMLWYILAAVYGVGHMLFGKRMRR
jgi:hypothetical protein